MTINCGQSYFRHQHNFLLVFLLVYNDFWGFQGALNGITNLNMEMLLR